jgi:putative DNA primase/helicase
MMLENNSKFRATWEHKRTPKSFPKGKASPSEYAQSIASISVSAGCTDQEVANLIIAWNRNHGHDMKKATRGDYLARTIIKARAFVKEQMVDPEITHALARNEDGDAKLFVKEHTGRWVFDHAAGRWYFWQDHYWTEDKVNDILRALDPVIYRFETERKKVKKQLNIMPADAKRKKKMEDLENSLKARIYQLSSHYRKTKVLKIAGASKSGLSVTGEQWDQKPLLLPCSNGVVDLKTGQLHDGQPGQYLKTVCPTVYDPNAIPPAKLLQFLDLLFDSGPKMVSYIQQLFGLSLIGQYIEPVFPVFYGPTGQNAKGTLIETKAEIIGPLAGPIESELLLERRFAKSPDSPSPSLMNLRGKRLVWGSETNQGRDFDASLVKRLAGGDPIIAREPHGKRSVTFNPTHTLFLLTNKLPASDGWDDAFFARIHVIHFKYSFLDNPDPTKTYQKKAKKRFKDVLLAEREGILKWLVEGAVAYLNAGNLKQPVQVLAASQQYRNSQDTVLNFKSNRLEDAPGSKISASVLYDEYVDYCDQNDLDHVGPKSFKPLMEKLYEHKRQNDRRYYLDVRIKPDKMPASHLKVIKGDTSDGTVTA